MKQPTKQHPIPIGSIVNQNEHTEYGTSKDLNNYTFIVLDSVIGIPNHYKVLLIETNTSGLKKITHSRWYCPIDGIHWIVKIKKQTCLQFTL